MSRENYYSFPLYIPVVRGHTVKQLTCLFHCFFTVFYSYNCEIMLQIVTIMKNVYTPGHLAATLKE